MSGECAFCGKSKRCHGSDGLCPDTSSSYYTVSDCHVKPPMPNLPQRLLALSDLLSPEDAAACREAARVIERFTGRTADDERFGYGDKVYYVDPVGYVQGLDVSFSFKTDDSCPGMVYYPYPIYKQRENAEQAAKAKEKA